MTSARRSKTLDADERNKRYLLTMAVRVACFTGGVLAPNPWNWVLFVGAAVIPPIAVVLANAVDRRRPVDVADSSPSERPALGTGGVVPGSVED
ncbi:MAG: DUF3099 domain-containing protein [Micropruina sp.]|nr:DUF3099 domain-containing protein [Micropruina sp.]